MQLRMYVPIDEDEGAAGANACSRGMHYTCTRPSTERERERERERGSAGCTQRMGS